MRNPMATVIYNATGATTSYVDSTTVVHPAWKGNPNWFDTPDIALVRVKHAIAVLDTHGSRITEFRRPIYVGSADYIDKIESNSEIYSRSGVCGYGGSTKLTCGEANGLRAQNGYVIIDGSSWVDGAHYEPGDSGGRTSF